MKLNFIKKISHVFLLPLFAITVFVGGAISAMAADTDISSVGYVHHAIDQIKNINIPVPADLETKHLSSVKYLMKQIDDANEILNGTRTTDYMNSNLAVKNVIVKAAVDLYVDDLIQKLPAFEVTVSDVNSFDFQISAAGNFTIVWGDGAVDKLDKTDINNTRYSHTYPATGNYTIRIMGKATGYSPEVDIAAISFSVSSKKSKIKDFSGNLGHIFSTLPDGTNPRFSRTFYGCNGLTGSIPEGLFDGIYGAPVENMFSLTFCACAKMPGPIPPGLFGEISGPPAKSMFEGTFANNDALNGSIPTGLFGKFSGPTAEKMFYFTFNQSYKLTGIEDGIWDLNDVEDSSARMAFGGTFRNCSSIISPSPTIAAGSDVKLWEHFPTLNNPGTFLGATSLADYDDIPDGWK